MSGTVTDNSNGFNYDFGVSIARGTVAALTATVAAVYALTESISGLVSADEELITMINKNQISFGGYANTMKALAFAEQKAAEGIGFNTADLVDGFNLLQRSGMNAKKETDLVAKASRGMGASFSETARIIQTGDFSALAEAGIISQRTAMSYDAMGYSARAATKHVHALIEQANKKGMFNGAVQSISSIMTRFKQFKTDFVMAIIGDPRDPEGLAFNVKKYMTKIADFINKHRNTIIYYGKMIGRVFRFVIDIVGDFIKTMWKQFFGVSAFVQKSNKAMQDNLLSLGLWLEILRIKIKMFFEDYGKYIVYAVKAFMLFKGLKFVFSLFSSLNRALQFSIGFISQIIPSLRLMGRYLRYVASVKMSSIISGIESFKDAVFRAATGQWGLNAAITANPIGAVIVAVAALTAGLAFLYSRHKQLIEQYKQEAAIRADKAFDKESTAIDKLVESYMQLGLTKKDAYIQSLALERQSIGSQRIALEEAIRLNKKAIDETTLGKGGKIFGEFSKKHKQAQEDLVKNSQALTALANAEKSVTAKTVEAVNNGVIDRKDAVSMLKKQITPQNAKDILSPEQRIEKNRITSVNMMEAEGRALYAKKHGTKVTKPMSQKLVGATSPTPTSSSATPTSGESKITYPKTMSKEQYAAMNGLTVAPGAVQININGGKVDEEKLATMVTDKLKRMATRETVRKGK